MYVPVSALATALITYLAMAYACYKYSQAAKGWKHANEIRKKLIDEMREGRPSVILNPGVYLIKQDEEGQYFVQE